MRSKFRNICKTSLTKVPSEILPKIRKFHLELFRTFYLNFSRLTRNQWFEETNSIRDEKMSFYRKKKPKIDSILPLPFRWHGDHNKQYGDRSEVGYRQDNTHLQFSWGDSNLGYYNLSSCSLQQSVYNANNADELLLHWLVSSFYLFFVCWNVVRFRRNLKES